MLLFVVGLVLGLGAVIFALLWLLFAHAPHVKKHKVPTTDFVAPDEDFASAVVGAHARVPDPDVMENLCDNLLQMQGVPPGLYSMEKDKEPIPRLSAWTGCLQTVGIQNPTLPVSFESRWTVNYLTLLPRAQMLVFSDSGAWLGFVHLDRCVVSGEQQVGVEALQGCAVVKLCNPGGLPILSFSKASTLYILLSSTALQKTWMTALTNAAVECEHALDRAFARNPPPSWLDQQNAEKGGEESLEWLNLFLERYVADMFQSQTYYYRTMKMLSDKLLLIRKPTWISSISLKELNIGNANFNLSFVSFHSGTLPKEMIGVVDLVYKGGLRISYGGVLNIGKSLRVPVEVLVHLESLSGRMYLSCPEVLHTKWSAYFRQMPTVNVTVKVIVGGLNKNVEVTSLNRLHKFAQKTFLKQLELALVFPSRLRFFLPLSGRKSQLKSLRFNPELGGYQYVVPLDPSLIPADKKYVSKIDDRKDIISIWDMKGTLKADLREFIVRRLFGVVLNHGYLKLLEQLVSSDVRLLAGWPQIEFLGTESVYQHFKQLYLAFDDFEVQIISVVFDSSGDATCRWRITGIHKQMLWDVPPCNKRVEIIGMTQIVFEANQFRISQMRDMLRLPFLSKI